MDAADAQSCPRILVVEDEVELARLVQIHLVDQGWHVELCHDGREGLEAARSGNWSLLILDLMLPGIDGLQICRQLRAEDRYLPILMLTARTTEIDRVLGLELGADDYLTKPFSVRELVARVKAILRRTQTFSKTPSQEEESTEILDLVIDHAKREVRRSGQALPLTAKEFDLLAFFAARPGRVFTRAQLLDRVWGYGHDGYEHTVNSHINRLRSKIEDDPRQPSRILTVWGVGYKLAESSDRELS